MANVIVILILLILIGGIGFYLWREKKRGVKCIGCPYARQCSRKCAGGCGHTDPAKKH